MKTIFRKTRASLHSWQLASGHSGGRDPGRPFSVRMDPLVGSMKVHRRVVEHVDHIKGNNSVTKLVETKLGISLQSGYILVDRRVT